MGWRLPLLTPREVRANLKSLGFYHKSTRGSHEHWERPADHILPQRKLVTVDAAESQFREKLMKLMIRESGFDKYEFCSGQYSKKTLEEAEKRLEASEKKDKAPS